MTSYTDTARRVASRFSLRSALRSAALAAGLVILLVAPPPAPADPLPAYADLILADGPLAYWRMNDTNLTRMWDTSGHGGIGMFSGSAGLSRSRDSPVQDDPGGLRFDGATSSASAPLKLAGRSAITLEFWMAWDSFADDDRLAFELTSGTGTYQATDGFLVNPNSAFFPGHFEVSLGDGSGSSSNTVLFNRPTAGDWHYYAILLDRSAPSDRQIVPYVDGVQVSYTQPADYARAPAPGQNRFADGVLSLMSRGGTDLFGAGSLNEVAIYPAALTASRIAEHFQIATGAATRDVGTSVQALTPRRIPVTAPELPNPLRGEYEWYGDPVAPPQWPFQDSYTRLYWKELETAPGAYDFSRIDAQLASAAARGGRFGFRVMSACTGCGEGETALPEYLASSSGAWYASVGGERFLIPDWNNDLYLTRWEALMAALGTRYANDPRIGIIDIGGAGNWGEWHDYPYAEQYPGPRGQMPLSDRNAQRIVEASLAAFPPNNHLLVIRTANSAALRYAFSRSPHVGLRLDCLGGGAAMEGDREALSKVWDVAADRWKTAPVVTEWCATIAPSTNLFQTFGVPQVQEFHVSMLSSGNFVKTDAGHLNGYLPAEQDGFMAANKLAGYRFALTKLSLPRVIPSGADFTIEAEWENTNVAPAYLAFNVMYQLRDADDAIVWQGRSGIDLRQLLPTGGSPTSWSDRFTLDGTSPGTYALDIQVLDPGQISPPLNLAMDARQPDGSYPLGSVSVR
ncbi:MAG: LamG-like jellyroll fold domain-containing protein [Chloroflexota bacterium]